MLGSLLIQPQTLARIDGSRPRSADEDLADEILALLHRIVLDPAAMAAIVPAGKAAGDAMGVRLAALVQPNLTQGLAALQSLFAPVVARFEALGQGPSSANDLLLRIADGMAALAGATGSLSDDAIRAFVRRVAQIAQRDFGLDARAIAAEAKHFVADFRTRLSTDPDVGAAATRHALACLLGRIERDLLPLLPGIDLSTDRLADTVIAELRRSGLVDVRDRAQCLLGKIEAVLRAVADTARLLAARGFPAGAPRPMAVPARAAGVARGSPSRAQDAHFCWYASWLYARRRQGSGTDTSGGHIFLQVVTNIFTLKHYPEDEVWHSEDRKTLVLRRAAGADEILYRSDIPFEWYEAPQFKGDVPVKPSEGAGPAEHFLMRRIEGPFLETWAHVTSLLADFTIGLVHIIQMATSPNEFAVNAQRWMWTWTNAAVSMTHVPLPSLIAWKAGTGVGLKFVFSPLLVMIGVALGSLEGKHSKTNGTNIFLQYLTMLGGDALSSVKADLVVRTLRELSLSVFTLINNDGPRDAPQDGPDLRPANREMSDPVVSVVNTLLGMLFIKLIRREDHGLPIGGDATRFVLWWVVGAPLMGFVGAFSGVLVAWGIARATTLKQLRNEPLLAALIGGIIFPVTLYNTLEGDTDDGRYNPSVDPQGNAFAAPRLPFNGYPPAGNSPYRLPYAAGKVSFIGQANQGFFSHMRYGQTVQVYAYDFAHDFQDEVLCVRDGTVVDWFDFYPDDRDLAVFNAGSPDAATGLAAAANAQAAGLIQAGQSGRNGNLTGNWNFVLIRHDTHDPVHDLDQGGSPVYTFAEYGHGANGGVRAAFALRGIAVGAIIGTKVTQGQAVMLAGDTGTSFHNHLHLHVRAMVGAPVPPAVLPAVPPPFGPGNLSPYTLPFVFREARHVLGRDGPLRHLTWYTSENPRTG
ncbi:MAG: hypothetical protein ABIO45_01810 [Burkholderiaceae bacterium]